MSENVTDAALEKLLVEAGQRHHAAYIESDGADPEWPMFYAAYVQTKLWDGLGVLLTRSELVHVLVSADHDIRSGREDGDWSEVYARRLRAFSAEKAALGS